MFSGTNLPTKKIVCLCLVMSRVVADLAEQYPTASVMDVKEVLAAMAAVLVNQAGNLDSMIRVITTWEEAMAQVNEPGEGGI